MKQIVFNVERNRESSWPVKICNLPLFFRETGIIFPSNKEMILVIRVAILCLFSATAMGEAAGPFSVKVNEVSHPDGVVSEIVISSKTGEKIKKIQQGFVENIRYNKARTICAINCRPGTQINDVYIIISTLSGKIRVVEGFSDRIGDALMNMDSDVPADFIEVMGIANRTFDVGAGTKGEAHYDFKVELTDQGKFRIIPKSISKSN